MTQLRTTSAGAPPSRGDNPFATCWTQPGALPYFANQDARVDSLTSAWLNAGERGQVVGPHGVGKSTLLTAVGDALADRGWVVRSIVFRVDDAPSFRAVTKSANGKTVLLVDGLEQLSRWRCWRLLRRCRATRIGVLATSHRPLRSLPVLAELAPSLPLALRLYRELTRTRATPVTETMVTEAFHAARGDVREMWFQLYDRHEVLTNA